jgi:hypothetical protein
VIAEKRAELAELLADLGTVHPTVPEQPIPPCVIIQPADPFLTLDDDDATFVDPYVIGFDVLLLVPLDSEHDNEQASVALDALLDELSDTVRPSAWWIDSMGQPGALLTQDWIEHGQRVTVQTRIQL